MISQYAKFVANPKNHQFTERSAKPNLCDFFDFRNFEQSSKCVDKMTNNAPFEPEMIAETCGYRSVKSRLQTDSYCSFFGPFEIYKF